MGDFDPAKPGGFRNVHTNVVFEHAGSRLVVEVQLHLSALFIAAKMIHGAYEVVRAETPAEVVGPPYKWTDHSLSEGRGMIVEHQDTLQSVTPKYRRGSTKSELTFSVAKTILPQSKRNHMRSQSSGSQWGCNKSSPSLPSSADNKSSPCIHSLPSSPTLPSSREEAKWQ